MELFRSSLSILGLNWPSPRPLCDVCLSMFNAVRSAPTGSWRGSKPRSFGYPETTYLWGGAHHVLPGSFLRSVNSWCYICYTIFRDCNDSQRELARSFQIFYRIYELQEEGLKDQLMRYGLRFGIEVEQNDQAVLGEFFYDCQGDFKILPFEGTSELIRLVMAREVSLTLSSRYTALGHGPENTEEHL
jgi:hypothetical protein